MRAGYWFLVHGFWLVVSGPWFPARYWTLQPGNWHLAAFGRVWFLVHGLSPQAEVEVEVEVETAVTGRCLLVTSVLSLLTSSPHSWWLLVSGFWSPVSGCSWLLAS